MTRFQHCICSLPQGEVCTNAGSSTAREGHMFESRIDTYVVR
jgi:hypothetical protein